MLRTTKVFLILSVALWAFAAALQNIVNWDDTILGVSVATTMSTFEGGAESWQATSNPIVIWTGAFFIILAKIATGVLCVIGAHNMWHARHSDSTTFSVAKELALVGCAIALFMLFAGFIVVAETWFEMWRSEEMRSAALETAFRYAGMITLIALFVGMRDE